MKVRNPLSVFKYVHYDPFAVTCGLHHFLTGDYSIACVQTLLFIASMVLFSQYAAVSAAHARVCCYPNQSPTPDEYAAGGACDDPQSQIVAYNDGSLCDHTPLTQILLLSFAGAALFGVFCVYAGSYRRYNRTLTHHLKHYLSKHTYTYTRAELEGPDGVDGGHSLYSMVMYVQLFPVTGIILGLHERLIGHVIFYYSRQLFFWGGFIFFIITYILMAWNRTWGCYPNFKAAVGPLDELSDGRCDDSSSIAFTMSNGGRYVEWTVTVVFLILFIVCAVAWLVMYTVRWTGVKIRNSTIVDIFLVSFMGALDHYEAEFLEKSE